MVKFRNFKCVVDRQNRLGIEEKVEKIVKGDEVKLEVLVCLDRALYIVNPAVFRNGMFINMASVSGVPVPIYYLLDGVEFIVVINISFIGDTIVKKDIRLYRAIERRGDYIVARPVSNEFADELKIALADNLTNYIVERGNSDV